MSNHRIYHSLGNNNQMFGCDRELFLINILTCGTFAFLAMDLVITISMVVIGFFNFALLVHMSKKDMLLHHIYIRQLRYHMYYQAQSSWHCSSFKVYR